MPRLDIEPTHQDAIAYRDNLTAFKKSGGWHAGAVRSALQELLEHCGLRHANWEAKAGADDFYLCVGTTRHG